ncbi:hypothetical protein PFISCL1PPCAC_9173, partial [Pristionchus fissidentatus]
SVMATLEFGEVTQIEEFSDPRQAPDGTIFYTHGSTINVLYNGQKVTAIKSWDGGIRNIYCFGDAFYFLTGHYSPLLTKKLAITNKIYKATFHPPNEIR